MSHPQYQNAIKFDIETNGLLDVLDTVHCISYKEGASSITSANHQRGGRSISEALEILEKAPVLVGHNILDFDIPALQKVYPSFKPQGIIRDTLVMSRLMYPESKPHALQSWGERLGVLKGDFGTTTDWKHWSQEMEDYCVQDVEVTDALWNKLLKEEYPEQSIQLEHDFAEILLWQMQMGIPFNEEAAIQLALELEAIEAQLRKDIKSVVPDWISYFTPKVNNKRYGYTKGVTIERRTPFNPGSRKQVYEYFMGTHNWNPIEFTKTGLPKVSGDILRGLPYPEALVLADYFDAKKLLGQLLTGDAAWLKEQKNGRIYGRINHNGAVTGRCTHSGPNLAQVPRVSSFKGHECRSLFTSEEGYNLVGCDASGLELRNLAHYMASYDAGAYAAKVLGGDIHTANQEDAGLPIRDNAKTFIYALNYGAGDEKLGHIVAPDASPLIKKARGRELRSRFMTKVPAMRMLIDQVRTVAKSRGHLIGLDGRKLHIREDYRALNTLLQGAGSVIMKQATVLQWKWADRTKAYPVLHVHDETQNMVQEDYTDEFSTIAVEAIRGAGRIYNYKCDLDGEAKAGKTWAETH